MTTMNISLPQELRTFVDSQVAEGDYTSSSEYVRDILRREKDRQRVRKLILDGGASQLNDKPLDAEYFESYRKKARKYK